MVSNTALLLVEAWALTTYSWGVRRAAILSVFPTPGTSFPANFSCAFLLALPPLLKPSNISPSGVTPNSPGRKVALSSLISSGADNL